MSKPQLASGRKSFLIDGEVVIISDDWTPDFHALRTRRNGHAVVLYAFDLIEHDGDDQIANALGGTERTIKAHRHRMMECQSKLDGACFSC